MGKVFRLVITFDGDTKKCTVDGPIDEPELCYLGLELARRGIRDFNAGKVQKVTAQEMSKLTFPTAPVSVKPPNIGEMLKNGG